MMSTYVTILWKRFAKTKRILNEKNNYEKRDDTIKAQRF